MLPELHAFKVLFCAELVGVVASGHVTKMAVTPFDPQWPITPCYTQTSRLSFIETELLSIEVLHCGNREFHVFLRKIVEIILKNSSHPKNDVAVVETHFLTHYRLFYLVCYQSYTRSKCCFTPNSVGITGGLGFDPPVNIFNPPSYCY